METRDLRGGVVRLAAVAICLFTPQLVPRTNAQTLPSEWSFGDVGNPAIAGSATFSNGTFSINGAGADIWGTSDQFTFVNRPVSGDVTIVARVATLENINGWTKGWVMIRSSLNASSAHVSLFITPGHGVAFQYRSSSGSKTFRISGGVGQAPLWLKIERRGSTVTAFRSADGASWTVVAQQTLTLSSTFYAGLAVTSRDTTRLAKGTFDNVTVSPAASNQAPLVSLTEPAAGATYTSPALIVIAASASDADGVVTRVEFYAGSTLIGSDTAAPYAMSWSNVPAGLYPLTAVARDNAGGMTVSGTRDIRVHDPQFPRSVIFVPSTDHTTVDRYFLEIFPLGADPTAANPVGTQDLGKPAIVKGECQVDISQTTVALVPGSYIATVTAIGSGGATQSAASTPFVR